MINKILLDDEWCFRINNSSKSIPVYVKISKPVLTEEDWLCKLSVSIGSKCLRRLAFGVSSYDAAISALFMLSVEIPAFEYENNGVFFTKYGGRPYLIEIKKNRSQQKKGG